MYRVISIVVLFAICAVGQLYTLQPFASSEKLVIEDKKWKIFKVENMDFQKSGKKLILRLDENAGENAEANDLSIDFEAPLSNSANYQVLNSKFERNKFQSVTGNYSGKFYFSDSSISLLPQSTSIFAPGSAPGSFTIEFWVYFYKNYDNQYIVRYQGNNLSDENDNNAYGLSISTKDNKIVYQFDNFFWNEKKEPNSISISEDNTFQIYKWEHHAVSFNYLTGKLTTYRNGIEQEVKWVTENGKILSPIFNPQIKEELSAPLVIGQNGIFSLDNFKIARVPRDAFYLKKFKNQNAVIVTDVYKYSENISALNKLSFQFDTPDYSFLKMAYRVSDKYFTPDSTDIKWVYVQNNLDEFPESFQSGRYVQFKILVYPYEEMEKQIAVRSIELDYTPDKNPYPPVVTGVVPMDGSVKVNWVSSPEDDIAGYEIFYGNRVEDYVCEDALEGKSPVFVPASGDGKTEVMNYILTGLYNEKPYFISVRSVDKNGHRSGYSKEYYARPSTVHNEKRYSVGR